MKTDDRSSPQPEESETDPSMTGAGATPGSAEMSWDTSQPSADATKPETMPKTRSTAMPGEKDHHQPG